MYRTKQCREWRELRRWRSVREHLLRSGQVLQQRVRRLDVRRLLERDVHEHGGGLRYGSFVLCEHVHPSRCVCCDRVQ